MYFKFKDKLIFVCFKTFISFSLTELAKYTLINLFLEDVSEKVTFFFIEFIFIEQFTIPSILI